MSDRGSESPPSSGRLRILWIWIFTHHILSAYRWFLQSLCYLHPPGKRCIKVQTVTICKVQQNFSESLPSAAGVSFGGISAAVKSIQGQMGRRSGVKRRGRRHTGGEDGPLKSGKQIQVTPRNSCVMFGQIKKLKKEKILRFSSATRGNSDRSTRGWLNERRAFVIEQCMCIIQTCPCRSRVWTQ